MTRVQRVLAHLQVVDGNGAVGSAAQQVALLHVIQTEADHSSFVGLVDELAGAGSELAQAVASVRRLDYAGERMQEGGLPAEN